MPINSVLMYLIQNENEIPAQPMPNSAYYIIGKEVRIFDSAGHLTVFVLKDKVEQTNNVEDRLTKCEKKIEKIYKHLTSFSGDE